MTFFYLSVYLKKYILLSNIKVMFILEWKNINQCPGHRQLREKQHVFSLDGNKERMRGRTACTLLSFMWLRVHLHIRRVWLFVCQCYPKTSYLLTYRTVLKMHEHFYTLRTPKDISTINIVILSRCYHISTLSSTRWETKSTTMSSKGLNHFYRIMDRYIINTYIHACRERFSIL